MNVPEFLERKKTGVKISMVTCYDFWSARWISDSPIDAVLVGDSAAMVMQGFPDTTAADVPMICSHLAAVRRGAPTKFLVGDLPFLSYRKSLSESMMAVEALVRAGAQAVKLEGLVGNEEFIQHTVQSGVPVMGHLGLTPQFLHALGGYRVQGRDDRGANRLMEEARRLADLGCFSLVLECVPRELAAAITANVSIPTIGIGAGEQTDGQILVLHDLLGFSRDLHPKFVRGFMPGGELIQQALKDYHSAVRDHTFPSRSESYD